MTLETPGAAAAADTGSSIYDSGASNLDILESVGNSVIEENSPAAGGSGTGVSETTEPGASGTDGGAAGDTLARPEWYESAPAELKGLLDHGNVSAPMKKWLEEAYGELNGFKNSPIGSREAVQELGELFPGGIEDMRVAHENSQAFAREMEQFRSGDPGQQGELLAGLLQDENGPEAFISLTGNALELLRDSLPRDYTALASGITKGHLDEVTDGKFSSFFDSVRGVAAEYQAKLDAGDNEGAARLASKLGGYALQMSDWWGTAKNKLGYGEQGAAAATPGRPAVVGNKGADPNDKDVQYAQRDAQYFTTNYIAKHDGLVRPMVNSNLAKELSARKMELPEKWKQDVMNYVENGIKQNLVKDKQYRALETRIYKRNSTDPRRWDNSEKVAQVLLSNVKARAEKLVPVLLKQALDRLSELRPGAARQQQPGEKIRTGATTPSGGGGGNNWEADLKDGKISSVDAIQKMAGLN